VRALLALLLVGCSSADSSCPAAQARISDCIDAAPLTSCSDECTSNCYRAAPCWVIVQRLSYPQPGEADGSILYSSLDVCLAECA
jgi:hypothetical protein